MADLSLGSFLSDISAKDAALRSRNENTPADPLPPVRGQKAPPPMPAPAPAAAPKQAAPKPADAQAIWDEGAVAAAPATAKATKGTAHRKHAYEYFSEWDKFDVDGELAKLEESKCANHMDARGLPSRRP